MYTKKADTYHLVVWYAVLDYVALLDDHGPDVANVQWFYHNNMKVYIMIRTILTYFSSEYMYTKKADIYHFVVR